jgi:hypothetical protein
VANPTCLTNTTLDLSACYRQNVLDPIQQKGLLVYAYALELAAIGGTNYLSVLTTTLISDSACPPVTEDDLMAYRVHLAFVRATAAGATVPSLINDKIAAMNCLRSVPGGLIQLEKLLNTLECKLGVHKSYPQ